MSTDTAAALQPYHYPAQYEYLLRETADHEMQILHTDGLYRHLRFKAPTTSMWHWDLITWPGSLAIRGDVGEGFIFTRTEDMLSFFDHGQPDGHINPGYWSEKLTSGREAATSYSEKLFEAEVSKTLTDVEGDYPGIAEAWAEHVASEFNTEYEEEALRALSEFRFGEAYLAKCTECDWEFEGDSYSVAAVKARGHRRDAGDKHAAPVRDLTFTFSDMGEMQLQDFDWWFLWACRAIVWGIARYDRVRRYGLQDLATPKAVAA